MVKAKGYGEIKHNCTASDSNIQVEDVVLPDTCPNPEDNNRDDIELEQRSDLRV